MNENLLSNGLEASNQRSVTGSLQSRPQKEKTGPSTYLNLLKRYYYDNMFLLSASKPTNFNLSFNLLKLLNIFIVINIIQQNKTICKFIFIRINDISHTKILIQWI